MTELRSCAAAGNDKRYSATTAGGAVPNFRGRPRPGLGLGKATNRGATRNQLRMRRKPSQVGAADATTTFVAPISGEFNRKVEKTRLLGTLVAKGPGRLHLVPPSLVAARDNPNGSAAHHGLGLVENPRRPFVPSRGRSRTRNPRKGALISLLPPSQEALAWPGSASKGIGGTPGTAGVHRRSRPRPRTGCRVDPEDVA